MSVTTSDISKDIVIKFKNGLYLVIEFQHVNPGKGSAFVRTRLKNLESGKVIENTFKAGETIEIVDVEKKKMQFLYRDASGITFMDSATYDQITVPVDILGEKAAYFKEGQEATVLSYNNNPITVELPKKITLKVVDAPPSVRGDTAGNVTKEVSLETGVKVNVPLFIKEGDLVVINTETGEYVERA